MNENYRDDGWPAEAGRLDRLPSEMEPPPGLEARVTGALVERGLIAGSRLSGPPQWVRASLAAAASLLLLTVGFWVGRLGSTGAETGERGVAAVAQGSRYALLLYETEGFQRATGAELLTRYHEYSEWVARARQRNQFVTGEDLAVDRGRVIAPDAGAAAVTTGARLASGAALSGVFLITARDYSEAVDLAVSLPHLTHGGHVVVQEVIPTDQAPRVESSDQG